MNIVPTAVCNSYFYYHYSSFYLVLIQDINILLVYFEPFLCLLAEIYPQPNEEMSMLV